MKIAFACPSYGPVEPVAIASQRAAIMTAWTHGIQVRSDIFVDRVAWEGSRNIIVKAFLLLDKSFDGIFWCDADSVLPQNAIVDLAGPNQDVVTGIYYGRHPPYEPKIFMYKEATDSYFHIVSWPKTTSLFPIDAAGFGAIYTSRKVLEATTQTQTVPKFTDWKTGDIKQEEETFWFKFGRYSEDLSWCHQAKAKGFQVWCNPNVMVGHLGEVQIIGAKEREEFVDKNPESIGVQFKADEPQSLYTIEGKRKTDEPERTPEHHTLVLSEDMRVKSSA